MSRDLEPVGLGDVTGFGDPIGKGIGAATGNDDGATAGFAEGAGAETAGRGSAVTDGAAEAGTAEAGTTEAGAAVEPEVVCSGAIGVVSFFNAKISANVASTPSTAATTAVAITALLDRGPGGRTDGTWSESLRASGDLRLLGVAGPNAPRPAGLAGVEAFAGVTDAGVTASPTSADACFMFTGVAAAVASAFDPKAAVELPLNASVLPIEALSEDAAAGPRCVSAACSAASISSAFAKRSLRSRASARATNFETHSGMLGSSVRSSGASFMQIARMICS